MIINGLRHLFSFLRLHFGRSLRVVNRSKTVLSSAMPQTICYAVRRESQEVCYRVAREWLELASKNGCGEGCETDKKVQRFWNGKSTYSFQKCTIL